MSKFMKGLLDLIKNIEDQKKEQEEHNKELTKFKPKYSREMIEEFKKRSPRDV